MKTKCGICANDLKFSFFKKHEIKVESLIKNPFYWKIKLQNETGNDRIDFLLSETNDFLKNKTKLRICKNCDNNLTIVREICYDNNLLQKTAEEKLSQEVQTNPMLAMNLKNMAMRAQEILDSEGKNYTKNMELLKLNSI